MLGRSVSFDIVLASAALLRLVARRMLLPFVSWPDWNGRISAHYSLVLQDVFRHLGYLLLLASQPCPIWTFTWGIRPDLEVTFLFGCLWHFWRSLRSDQQVFLIASAQAGVSVPSNLCGDIQSCRWVFDCLTACLAVILSGGYKPSQCSTWFSRDLQSSRKDYFDLVSVSPKIFSQTSLLVVSWRRGYKWAASLLSDGVLM